MYQLMNYLNKRLIVCKFKRCNAKMVIAVKYVLAMQWQCCAIQNV